MRGGAHGKHAEIGRKHRRPCTANVEAFHVATFARPCLQDFEARRDVVAENVDELNRIAQEGVNALGVVILPRAPDRLFAVKQSLRGSVAEGRATGLRVARGRLGRFHRINDRGLGAEGNLPPACLTDVNGGCVGSEYQLHTLAGAVHLGLVGQNRRIRRQLADLLVRQTIAANLTARTAKNALGRVLVEPCRTTPAYELIRKKRVPKLRIARLPCSIGSLLKRAELASQVLRGGRSVA